MGVTNCYIHGHAGIGMACEHVIENIKNGTNGKCILVQVRALPGKNTSEIERAAGPFSTIIPFCLQCYEDKKMNEKMKLIDDKDNLEQALIDYKIAYGCCLCIDRYGEENKLN